MIAVGGDWGAVIQGNTIGSEKGIHGRFGIFINGGSSDINIEGNRIGGFKTNVVFIGARPTFKNNTFMGELDSENKHMNVRIASGNMSQENQNYPQYLGNFVNYSGSNYGVDRIDIDMTENYWSNVESNEIEVKEEIKANGTMESIGLKGRIIEEIGTGLSEKGIYLDFIKHSNSKNKFGIRLNF